MKRLSCLILTIALWFMMTLPVTAIPEIESEAAILFDGQTGQVLYSKNANAAYYAAGFVKLVNAFTAIKHGNLDNTVQVNGEVLSGLAAANSVGLVDGERLRLEDAIYATIIAEAEDAATVVADNLGGEKGVTTFRSWMSEDATYLGAATFNIATVAGTANEAQTATVTDIAYATLNALKNEDFYRILTAGKYQLPATNKVDTTRPLTAKHKMVNGEYDYANAKGGLTAYSSSHGNHLMTYAEKDDRTLICVTMAGTEDTVYDDAQRLLEYGFNQWQPTTVSVQTLQAQLPASVRNKKITFAGAGNNGYTFLAPVSDGELPLVYSLSLNENIYLHGSITISLPADQLDGLKLAEASFYEASPNNNQELLWRGLLIGSIVLVALLILFIMIHYRRNRYKKYRGVPTKPTKSALRWRFMRKKANDIILPKKEWNYLDYHEWTRQDWVNYYRNEQRMPNQEAPARKRSNRQIYEERRQRSQSRSPSAPQQKNDADRSSTRRRDRRH